MVTWEQLDIVIIIDYGFKVIRIYMIRSNYDVYISAYTPNLIVLLLKPVRKRQIYDSLFAPSIKDADAKGTKKILQDSKKSSSFFFFIKSW